MSTEDDLDFSELDQIVKDRIYAKDVPEGARHFLARETFLSLYLEKPEVKALMDELRDEWTRRFAKTLSLAGLSEQQDEQWDRLGEEFGEEMGSRVIDFVREHGSYFTWLPFELILRVLATARMLFFDVDDTIDYHLRDQPIDIEAFPTKPGESLSEQVVRWEKYKAQIDKKLAQVRGRIDKRSEAAVRSDVGWYFENEFLGRGINELARELMQKSDDNKGFYSEREKVRDGIRNAKHLLNLALPTCLDSTES